MSSKIEPANHPRQARRYKVALLVAGVIAYQVLVYRAIADFPDGLLGEILMVAPLLVVLGCVLGRSGRGRVLLVGFAMVGAIGALLWRAVGANPALFYPVPHVIVYSVLLWLFGRTLVSGRQPLITRLAIHVHGDLPPEIAGYTRRVTWAWCVFFTGMALTSVLLFVFAPLSSWSVFNNLLNLPLVVVMYLTEYAWRRRRFPDFSHASIAVVVRAFRDFDFNRPAAGR